MESLSEMYAYIMAKADPRTGDWFLMSSPVPTVIVVVLYLVFVYKGQTWMKDRPAFNLKRLIIVYNFVLVILSSYMVFELVMSSWSVKGFSLLCEKMDYSDNPTSVRLAKVVWWFYFSKIIELMDTVFFVLRKKNNQISFLHVYHHSTMPLLWWTGVKFVAGGEAFFSPSLNCFIHALMYSYYMLSAMGPAMQPYLWWKKYMTTLQLIQFWLIVFKTSYSVYIDCGYPKGYGYCLIGYCISHIMLFSNFYYNTYTKNAKLQQQKKKDNGNQHIRHEETNNKKHQNGSSVTNGTSNIQARKVKKFE